MWKPQQKHALLDALATSESFWLFTYGSLMWNPGFAFKEQCEAILYGYHRAMCLVSHEHRGTIEKPGLVLALDRGGSCRGIVYHIPDTHGVAVVDYLWRREMVTGAYNYRCLQIVIDGTRRQAHTFVADRAHEQYAGDLNIAETVALIRQGVGARGPCTNYLAATVAHLDQLGIPDHSLHQLLNLIQH